MEIAFERETVVQVSLLGFQLARYAFSYSDVLAHWFWVFEGFFWGTL